MRPAVWAMALSTLASPIAAAESSSPTYLIAIGYNGVPEAWARDGLEPLRYADDDAIAFFAFARDVGWQSTLLTVPDTETQRRWPEEAALARPPDTRELGRVLEELQARFAEDREAGRTSQLVVFYSGHGRRGPPALALLDGTLTQAVLYDDVLAALPARYVHLFVDAGHADSVVRARGEPKEISAEVVPVSDEDVARWIEDSSLSRFPQVGAMVATAADGRSHEWDLLGRGVFTHEVVSGLRGGADINGDRRIEYSELHAFVSAANRQVDAPRAKLDVVVRSPALNARAPIVDLSSAPGLAWIEGGTHRFGRFFVEDDRGTRLLDSHAEPGHRIRVAVPGGVPLRLVSREGEAALRLSPGERVDLSELTLEPASVRSRGAVASALKRGLFAATYGPLYYQGFIDRRGGIPVPIGVADAVEPPASWPSWVLWAGAGALTITGAVFGGLALDARSDFDQTTYFVPAQQARDRYDTYRAGFMISLSAAAVAAATGALLSF